MSGALLMGSGARGEDNPQARPAADPRLPDPELVRGDPPLFSPAVRTVGATRTAQFFAEETNTIITRIIASAWETDVRSLTIYAGNNDASPLTGPRGEIRLTHAAADPGTATVVHFFNVKENGATHYEFPSALALRQGDELSWIPASAGQPAELIQVTFQGTVPIDGSGAMVR